MPRFSCFHSTSPSRSPDSGNKRKRPPEFSLPRKHILYSLSLSPRSPLFCTSRCVPSAICEGTCTRWSRTISTTFSFLLRSSLTDYNCPGGRKSDVALHFPPSSSHRFPSFYSSSLSLLPWPGSPYYRVMDITAFARRLDSIHRLRLTRCHC